MQVAKITLWDGRVFYSDHWEPDFIRGFFKRVREAATEPIPDHARNQIDLIEMTEAEYVAIGASIESARLFGQTT